MRVPVGGTKRLRAIFARYARLRPEQGKMSRSAFGSGPKANTFVMRHSTANYIKNTKHIGLPSTPQAKASTILNITANSQINRLNTKMRDLTNIKMMRKTHNRIEAIRRIRVFGRD